MNSYDFLIQKLDEFIRRYYKNRLLKGSIYSIALLLIFFIVAVISEYLGWFSSNIRAVIFYLYILFSLIVLYCFVFSSILKLFKIGKRISYYRAADIIKSFFPEIEDKLLNVLQLKKLDDYDSNVFVEEAINQKLNDLNSISFKYAVKYSTNLKYLKYAIVPIILFVVLYVFIPESITQPTKRLINYSVYYEPDKAFDFYLINESIDVVFGEDLKINVKIKGKQLPGEVFLVFNGNNYSMKKIDKNLFSYIFKNVRKNFCFNFMAGKEFSRDYCVNVLPKPDIYGFKVFLEYPNYTQIEDQVFDNIGDLSVPEGTVVKWKISTSNVNCFGFSFSDGSFCNDSIMKKLFIFERKVYSNVSYKMIAGNFLSKIYDTLNYNIDVIRDAYPSIDVKRFSDSLFDSRLYFTGFLKDDYGVSNLKFIVNSIDHGRSEKIFEDDIKINKNSISQQFTYFVDLNDLDVVKGDFIEYYFEVWDNDAINGHKSSRSDIMNYKIATYEEIAEQRREDKQKVISDIESSIKSAAELIKMTEDVKKDMIDKQSFGWDEKNKLQNILDNHQLLEHKMDELKNFNAQNNLKEDVYNPLGEEIKLKRDMLQKLFDEVMSDDMKKLFDDLKKMMDNINKNELSKKLDDIKLSSEDLLKQLDRELQLYKNLEFEKKLNDVSAKLSEIKNKQDELKSNTDNGKNNDLENFLNSQNELREEFDFLKNELNELNDINSDIEQQKDLSEINELAEQIMNDMKGSSESLENKNRKKSSQQQGEASQKMEEMSMKISAMQSDLENDDLAEDIRSLREILENLLTLSFDNELLLKNLTDFNINGPKFVELIDRQNKIKNNFKLVEDSLLSLARRQIRIKNIIFDEILKIRKSIEGTLFSMSDRRIIYDMQRNMQSTVTSMNNLSLLISEVIDAMNDEMNSMASGDGKCKSNNNKSGGKKSKNISSMRQMQQQINKQMQSLQQMMKEGQGSGQFNKELAKLAAQQEALRQELQKMMGEMKNEGLNSGDLQSIAKQMEQTENDLVNKILNNQTINRQKDIETRLLQSEKAQMEREKDDRRESEDAKGRSSSKNILNIDLNEFDDKGNFEIIKSIPPSLNQYYKDRVNEYFMKLK